MTINCAGCRREFEVVLSPCPHAHPTSDSYCKECHYTICTHCKYDNSYWVHRGADTTINTKSGVRTGGSLK